ncbi:hypothetical protein C2G38_2027618 [Gigaspora rosea]|uniref:Uncharacterized protein n=1 Tax=Gigaspora rosea TaxID=44941 RepID=A0A397W7M3_9GLOM|nr:hypothetical protein C2G38_2027618 [Gigaspora rosea]
MTNFRKILLNFLKVNIIMIQAKQLIKKLTNTIIILKILKGYRIGASLFLPKSCGSIRREGVFSQFLGQTWNCLKDITKIIHVPQKFYQANDPSISQWYMSSGQRTFDGCIGIKTEFAPGTPGCSMQCIVIYPAFRVEARDLLDFRVIKI